MIAPLTAAAALLVLTVTIAADPTPPPGTPFPCPGVAATTPVPLCVEHTDTSIGPPVLDVAPSATMTPAPRATVTVGAPAPRAQVAGTAPSLVLYWRGRWRVARA